MNWLFSLNKKEMAIANGDGHLAELDAGSSPA